ncbi:Excinuclease ABC subunit C [Candidatus Koribacter versatilis Ellin345]|uniref:UvrABC system protein C n=1 Tax=Koribacter versatilis (strain Ellin345) TaxID=204669 RepID=UVRC_KORVE|nr:excinuclease ABC subunit UvrC [Candidatus Koribacter versatilis]Q1ILY2.1 RecName: Full=UvrABC system protein C; Short=Protein UvrC; AltName: Full=Excinuclease ABC subunit C [Candidatus Koribacter versatilis Ellin345]ABF42118.1 Excinuclease ABC subunit C [Candidatus Koribacter versatilis Ellin345]
MDLHQKIRTLPTSPGVYLYKNAEGEIIYVGKAKNLRSRVGSYFVRGADENSKTGSLLREAVDVEYIVVDNEKEALALENNLIKQKKPRFNILLRDDKTYPYIKLTMGEKWPRVYVTRRLKKDGSEYYGPFFPANLAYRVVDLIHRNFLVPSCYIDLRRYHPRPCLQHYIGRCLGPCVEGLTNEVQYGEAVKDVKLFLEGRHSDLKQSLTARMNKAAEGMQFELAAKYRDLITTVEDLHQKQRIAAAEGDDADVFGYHYENHMVAVNLFHMRGGKVLDRRDFFFEDLGEMEATGGLNTGEFFSTLLQQIYLDNKYVPRTIYVPVEFEDREALCEILSEQMHRKIDINVPQRGDKRSLIDLVAQNAKQSYDQRFRVMRPQTDVLKSVLQDTLELPELPNRIECFDISHIQGAETVASMVVWEDGKMKKSDYRKFIIKTVQGVDDFASMREVVTRRYKRIVEENQPMPSLVLIDGGVGQLHAAAGALEAIGITNQPLASIAKREEIIYVHGREDEPIRIDHHSPVLHIIQLIRDEAHRFAITFHRKRREIRDRSNELLEIPGIGEQAMKRLLRHFGSIQSIRTANATSLEAVVNRTQAEAILAHFRAEETTRS